MGSDLVALIVTLFIFSIQQSLTTTSLRDSFHAQGKVQVGLNFVQYVANVLDCLASTFSAKMTSSHLSRIVCTSARLLIWPGISLTQTIRGYQSASSCT